MQRETIFGKPLGEDRHEALRITFCRAQNHDIVRQAVQSCFPVKPWFHHLLEPRIEDDMEKDIRQDGRHPRALRYPSIRMYDTALFQDTRVEPFVNRASNDAVTYPLVRHCQLNAKNCTAVQ